MLAERRRWLATDSARYAAMSPEGEPLLTEFAPMAEAWDCVGPALAAGPSRDGHENRNGLPTSGSATHPGASAGAERWLHELGGKLEPDILFLSPDAEGRFRLRGGALVFPTGWALQEKLGETLEVIHGVVPGLNPAIGGAIQQFLSKLKPGVAFLRDNWGLAATDELNLHPARGIAAPTSPVDLERLWLRVEHQALVALPATRGILFGIRIALHRLDEIAGTAAGAGLRRALETMPAALAAYKRIDVIRAEVAVKL